MSWSRRRAVLLLPILGLALGGCGFAPLYGKGTPAAGMHGRISVAPLDGAAGFALRERLIDRLGSGVGADWLLEVDLDIDSTGAALTQENVTTRFDVTGTASFLLRPVAGGPPVLVESVQAITSFSAPVSETSSAFASRIAGQDAELRVGRTLAEKIVLRLAVAADKLGPAPAAISAAAAGR